MPNVHNANRQFRRPSASRWRLAGSTLTLATILVLVPLAAHAQSPFDTGFTALQTLFTGTVAKVASLIAIVIGGYQFAHGEPGAKKALAGRRCWIWYRRSSGQCADLAMGRLAQRNDDVHPNPTQLSRGGYRAGNQSQA
jgi:type IV secretory pathway VirB2 component (pilin)